MSDINWSFVDEINERSKDDRAMIVGSEVRQLVMYLRQLRAEVAKDYGSGDLEKRFYTVSSIDKLKAERECLIDALRAYVAAEDEGRAVTLEEYRAARKALKP
jgi:hypothetical protein